MQTKIRNQIQESIRLKQSLSDELMEAMATVARQMVSCLQQGGKIAFCGNGGSAADSQHLAAELVGRYKRERKSWPAIAFTTNTSILSAIGNDYGFERIFARQVEGLLAKGDILMGISTSGNSGNILNAFQTAKEKNITTVAMTGVGGGKMKDVSDLLLAVPSSDTPRIQEVHIMIGHILCDLVEEALMAGSG